MVKEILVNVIIDYGLFSFIESLIFVGFFYYIGNLKKMKWYEIGMLGIGNALISQIFPAVFYQFMIVVWTVVVLKNINEDKKLTELIKIAVFSILYFFTIETFFSIILEYTINFDRFLNINDNLIFSFILLIPIRVIEVGFILLYKYKKGRLKNENCIWWHHT